MPRNQALLAYPSCPRWGYVGHSVHGKALSWFLVGGLLLAVTCSVLLLSVALAGRWQAMAPGLRDEKEITLLRLGSCAFNLMVFHGACSMGIS